MKTINIVLAGHVLDELRKLRSKSIQTIVTSPPYWSLRDYGTPPQVWGNGVPLCAKHDWIPMTQPAANGQLSPMKSRTINHQSATRSPKHSEYCARCGAWRGQLGLEPTPEMYVWHLVQIFHEAHRVLRDDGTLWLNIGDTYFTSGHVTKELKREGGHGHHTLKHKDLVGIPWQTVLALRAPWRQCNICGETAHDIEWGKIKDRRGITHFICPTCAMPTVHRIVERGWWLRAEIIWSKPNPVPESAKDRPTRSHEHIFLLTKNGGNRIIWRARGTGEWSRHPDLDEKVKLCGKWFRRWIGFDYLYNADAIAEPLLSHKKPRRNNSPDLKYNKPGTSKLTADNASLFDEKVRLGIITTKNKRSVWRIPTQSFRGKHWAAYPLMIPEICIKAGSRPGDTVLDPFAGSGTTLVKAKELHRNFIGIDLNKSYVTSIIKPRLAEMK
jgi:site-specific DNA-methyltransferase (cytosine-N4-specific)